MHDLELRLTELATELNVKQKLSQFSWGIQAATKGLKELKSPKNIGMCLVTLTTDDLKQAFDESPVAKNGKKRFKLNVKLQVYKTNDTPEALKELNQCEKNPDVLMCVLLSAKNAQNLKKAYPNYFGSTSDFRRFIKKHHKDIETTTPS
ncbi:hypothetical protein KLJ63_09230 [Vibrio splendidus]|nr:hypothetical protein KLJ63_09230 [Vibrio splendidus]